MVCAMKNELSKHARKLGYSNELVSPIALNDPRRYPMGRGLLAPVAPIAIDEMAWREKESVRKFHLLMAHYGVGETDSDDFLAFAFRVALDWVPGFSTIQDVPRRKGAPKKQDFQERNLLVIEVNKIRDSDKSISIEKACEKFRTELSNHVRWKSMSIRGMANLYRKENNGFAVRQQIVAALMSGNIMQKAQNSPRPISFGIGGLLGIPHKK